MEIKKAAIYHFTDESSKRPKIYRKQLKALKAYAVSLGFDDVDVYCDFSLKMCERTEFTCFMSKCNEYSALITKDFYHVSKNTGKCLSLMKELLDNGVQIYTIENGIFTWEDAPFDKPLHIATYTCHFGTPSEIKEVIPVKNDIFTLFCFKKTNWILLDQYFDECFLQKDSEQIQMKELIKKKDNYDLLLVHNLNDVHWRTANFCKIREQLQLDIYSLQEGFLRYWRNL